MQRTCDHLGFTANGDAELAAIEAANKIRKLQSSLDEADREVRRANRSICQILDNAEKRNGEYAAQIARKRIEELELQVRDLNRALGAFDN
jgi:polyhydroxyalkanoate synthesis regulator phasin